MNVKEVAAFPDQQTKNVELELAKLQRENQEAKERIKTLETNFSHITKTMSESSYGAT